MRMLGAMLALTTALATAGCGNQGSIAEPPRPGIPLSQVLNEIKEELAEYNRQAAAAPIRGNVCNGSAPVAMTLARVKVEVQSTLANVIGGEASDHIPVGPIPIFIDPSGGLTRTVTNRQTTVLSFDVPSKQVGGKRATATPPEDMNLVKALMTFRDQIGQVLGYLEHNQGALVYYATRRRSPPQHTACISL